MANAGGSVDLRADRRRIAKRISLVARASALCGDVRAEVTASAQMFCSEPNTKSFGEARTLLTNGSSVLIS